ncbi:MAG: hypothetical protein QG597_2629, partial [Actinomycetota bacterium]|nr:hypothetical protein [Actinomycetota bacterium]
MDPTMTEQRLVVHTVQRVAAGAGGPRAQHVAAHGFIPGSVLRGALAAAWIAARQGRGDGFTDLFEGSLRYSPALPDGSLVEPASRRWEKYPAQEGTPTGWFDVATGRCRHGDGCDGCAASAAHWHPEHNGLRTGDDGQMQVVTSTAIDPVSGAGRHGHLFSHAVLERDLVLRGSVRGPAHAVAALRDFLAEGGQVVLGGRGSVLGQSVVRLDGLARPCPEHRIVPGTVRILFPGPTLLVDDTGAPSTDLVGAVATALGIGRARVAAWSRPSVQPWGGWHTASGTRKPTDLALEGGAVAVIADVTDQETDACERLAATGLGLRRAEGFGWIEILGPHDDVLAIGPHPDPITEEQAETFHTSAFASLLDAVHAAGLDDRQRDWLIDRLRGARDLDLDAALAEETPSRLSARARQAVAEALHAACESGRLGNALATVLDGSRRASGPRHGADRHVTTGGADHEPETVPTRRRMREVYPFAGEPSPAPPAPPAARSGAVKPTPTPVPVDLRAAQSRPGGVRTYVRVELELLSAFHVGRSAGGHEDVGTAGLRPVLTTRAADGA